MVSNITNNNSLTFAQVELDLPNNINASQPPLSNSIDQKNEENTVLRTQRAKSLQQEFNKDKTTLEEKYTQSTQALERQYLQEKRQLEQEFHQKKRSLDINIYI